MRRLGKEEAAVDQLVVKEVTWMRSGEGAGCGSAVEHLPGVCESLSSIHPQ